MLVVADSSPINYLVEIEHVNILPQLFSRVVIPPEVVEELSRQGAPERVRSFIHNRPTWLESRSAHHIDSINRLDLGEQAAISLALELKPDFLLIDELIGRKEAMVRHIPVIGTVGVLERAADQSLLDLPIAIERLRGTRFHIAESLLDELLRRNAIRRAK
ncbi:MAG: DUF3368 domain-containing protein [Planctomycetes bacterium]|nr:DUF3368 domain-containing protein [Planctomycetota bacterium]